MNIFKYPVNEPCKQKQDPVCYACLTEVYLTKKKKQKFTMLSVTLLKIKWNILLLNKWSQFMPGIYLMTELFKPAKNQTNMKM